MISKIAFIFAALVALSVNTLFVDAQAVVLTSPGSGKTSPVQGFPISKSQFAAASTYGLFAPYAYTSAEIGLTSDDLVLIHTNSQSAKAFEWNIVWNFTAAESALIRTWFTSTALRNNCEVRFTATWDSTGRFAIDTSAWVFAFQSLMPYGLLSTCNLSAKVMQSRMTLAVLPASCSSVLVPGQIQQAISTPQCLLAHGRTALDIDTACSTVRAFLETVYCTDGAAGVDLVCSYNKKFLPSGIAGTVVVTVGADGTPTSGTAASATTVAPGSAGSLSTVAAIVVSVFVAVLAL